MNWPDNPTVLTLDEDSSPQIDTDIDPYGELEEQPDDDANKTYNNHVIDAKLNGVNPAVSNTAKVTEKEVESLFEGFLSIQKFMAAVMKTKTSGSHDSDPMQYTRRAISKSKTTKILTFSAFYFFCKSEKVQDFGFTFSAVLASSLVADSMPGSIANMKGSRSTSPVMMVSVPSSEQIADAICCRTRAKDAINPMTTQRDQQKKQKPHRGHVSEYTWQVHRSMVPMILSKMGFRTHRTNIVSLTRIKLRQIIQVDCCFYGTVRCVFYNII